MEIIKSINELRNKIDSWKCTGSSVGLVPTMGYLHEGHESLIRKARKENDKVVVSIFVNPIQFGPKEDFDKYPRDLNHDRLLCENAGADVIFAPENEEMYPENNIFTFVNVENLTTGLCGSKRPGHFQGVCTVVSKLFNIVKPNRAYFGEKDAQQLAVIKRMVKDLNMDIEIVGCPIIREEDGLAKSSRNTYLSKEERKAALILSKSLNNAKELLYNGEKDPKLIKNEIIKSITSEPLAKIDYVEIVDKENLQEIKEINSPILIALAVYIGKTRLIDNLSFK